MSDLGSLHKQAREIIDHTLRSIDPTKAICEAVQLNENKLRLVDTSLDVSAKSIYVIGIGKAARKMAIGLDQTMGSMIRKGIVVDSLEWPTLNPDRWQTFCGGHPLPNEASLKAAATTLKLLDEANRPDSVVIFLVSGGGSAMLEQPTRPDISLTDLRLANQILVTCGATISEINAVRRGFSAVKGGKLAQRAGKARIVTLIVSDTNAGDEASVASGPTLPPLVTSPKAVDVIREHRLESLLPGSIINCLNETSGESLRRAQGEHPYYIILSNNSALMAAAQRASESGFAIDIATEISEQEIEPGTQLLLNRLVDAPNQKSCVVSGGEFSCPVRGDGRGGRNLETALRFALAMNSKIALGRRAVAFSFGTDGIDGNSPAAGAIADPTTIDRARMLGVDGKIFLERSDSYSFFERTGDLIVTGPTGTNVRDLRILLRE